MELNEFIEFCKDVRDAQSTRRLPREKTYFRAIVIAYNYPDIHPPLQDEDAQDGYELGRELSEKIRKS